jgi:hypothetical protein
VKKNRRLQQSDVWWGLAAAALVLLQFWWLPGEDGSASDSYSTTVDGKLGLYRVLSQLFNDVERDAINAVPPEAATLLLVAPDRYPNKDEQQLLYEFVYRGGDLLFAPNWNAPDGLFVDEGTQVVKIPALGIDLTYRPGYSRLRATQTSAASPTSPAVSPASGTSAPGTSADAETPAASDSPALPGETPLPQEATVNASDANDSAPSSVSDPAAVPVPESTESPTAPTLAGAPPAVEPALVEDAVLSGSEVRGTSSLVSDSVIFRSVTNLNLPSHLTTDVLVTSEDGRPEVATWMMGAGRVVVCSSADLFSNRSLLNKNARRLAVRLVERCTESSDAELQQDPPRIVINEYFNASDSYRQTGILFSPGLRSGTLQLLLVAVLGIWMAFHRFGPAADVTTLQRRSLTESAQAVGNLQYNLRDGGTVIRGYMEYISSQLRRRHGSLLRISEADAIARRAGMTTEEVQQRLADAQKLADSDQLSAAQTATMLRWLAKLQQRLTGNRNVE